MPSGASGQNIFGSTQSGLQIASKRTMRVV